MTMDGVEDQKQRDILKTLYRLSADEINALVSEDL
jgi:hypothetical protein